MKWLQSGGDSTEDDLEELLCQEARSVNSGGA